jgi:hypothetical protein
MDEGAHKRASQRLALGVAGFLVAVIVAAAAYAIFG